MWFLWLLLLQFYIWLRLLPYAHTTIKLADFVNSEPIFSLHESFQLISIDWNMDHLSSLQHIEFTLLRTRFLFVIDNIIRSFKQWHVIIVKYQMYMIVLHARTKRYGHKHLYHKEIKRFFCNGLISAPCKIDSHKGVGWCYDNHRTINTLKPLIKC